jgi:hypothetical protein
MAQFRPFKQPYLWKNPDFPLRELWAELQPGDVREIEDPAGTMEWERGTYQLAEVLVLRPIESTEGQSGRRRFAVIVASEFLPPRGSMRGTWVYDSPPAEVPADGPRAKGGAPTKGGRTKAQGGSRSEQLWEVARRGIEGETALVVPEESWSKTVTTFEARPNQVNEWTIPLPDEVSDAIRERLKAGTNAKAE